jgi:hypothetical protein
MDQYPSHKALKDVFGFDNSRFENELSQRGFAIIPGSHSNYNLTPFSMASLLNMDYLGPGMGRKGNLDISYSYRQIRDNAVNRFLEKEGYEFYNLSMFDFPGQPAQHYEDFFPYGIELVSAQTLSGRLTRDLKADISAGRIRMPALQKKLVSRYLRYNEQILEKTKKIVAIILTAQVMKCRSGNYRLSIIPAPVTLPVTCNIVTGESLNSLII